jgi:phenylpropionate dioxygenase-like ring-hydroxylating dioxygenase large terminal subunit
VRHERQLEILDRLLGYVEARSTQLADQEARVPVSYYTSPERLAEESRVLFRRYPLIVGHASELPDPGDFMTHDASGVPLVIVRDAQGELRAFLNVCRHRGTRLVNEPSGRRKAFVCRYHAWSYRLDGSLLHVPLEEAFPSVKCEDTALVRVPIESRHGFLWVTPTPGAQRDVAASLGPFGEDLEAFGLANHHAYKKVVSTPKTNWKLVLDAFLEGYHVKSLHRDSLSRFFPEAGAVFEPFGPHVRSVGARKTILEARAVPRERWDIRAYATVFYYLFPNTILVFHPDWVSHLALYPAGTDRAVYMHTMLIPEMPTTEEARAHWEKTFQLIEGRVFQQEDLSIAESIQSVIHAGADTAFRIGRLEHPIRLFHDAIDLALATHAPSVPGGRGGSTGERPSPGAGSTEAGVERIRSGA